MEDRELRSVNMQVWKGLLRLMMSKGTVMESRMAVVVVVVVVVWLTGKMVSRIVALSCRSSLNKGKYCWPPSLR
jgi:hypothetical protein